MSDRPWGALVAIGAIIMLTVGLGVWMDGGFDPKAAGEMPLVLGAGAVVVLVLIGVAVGIWRQSK